MRFQGKVSKWLDNKGYGFVRVNGQEETIFAHISAFPKGQSRPQVGELVTFEIAKGIEKGPKAHSIEYVNRPVAKVVVKKKPAQSFAYILIAFLIIIGLGYWTYNRPPKLLPSGDIETSRSVTVLQVQPQAASFQCSGKRHCSEMVSCDEAKFYLNHCPGSVTDGDGDGIPCEDQWCGH